MSISEQNSSESCLAAIWAQQLLQLRGVSRRWCARDIKWVGWGVGSGVSCPDSLFWVQDFDVSDWIFWLLRGIFETTCYFALGPWAWGLESEQIYHCLTWPLFVLRLLVGIKMIKGILRKMVLMKVVLERSWPTRTIAVVPAQTGSIPSCVTLNSKTKMFELYTCYLVHMLQPMIVPDQGVGKRSPLTSWFRFASFSGPFQSQRKTRCSGVCKRGKGLVVLGRNLIPTQQMEILPRTANLERRGSWQIFKYVEELLWGCLGLGNQGYKELSPGFRAKMSDGSVAKAWQSSLVCQFADCYTVDSQRYEI